MQERSFTDYPWALACTMRTASASFTDWPQTTTATCRPSAKWPSRPP